MRDMHPLTLIAFLVSGVILASLMGDTPGPVGDSISQAAGWVRDVVVGLRAGVI